MNEHQRTEDLAERMAEAGIKGVALALRAYLEANYPRDVFTGESGDRGPHAVVAWRDGCALVLGEEMLRREDDEGTVCGAVSPRSPLYICIRRAGHGGSHNTISPFGGTLTSWPREPAADIVNVPETFTGGHVSPGLALGTVDGLRMNGGRLNTAAADTIEALLGEVKRLRDDAPTVNVAAPTFSVTSPEDAKDLAWRLGKSRILERHSIDALVLPVEQIREAIDAEIDRWSKTGGLFAGPGARVETLQGLRLKLLGSRKEPRKTGHPGARF